MKKSGAVPVTLLAAAAMLSLSGCETKQVQRCIDPETKQVVPDDRCDQQPVVVGHTYPYYRWYYGGHGYAPGDVVTEGGFDPAPKVGVVRASSPEGASVIRGGFGSGFFGGGE